MLITLRSFMDGKYVRCQGPLEVWGSCCSCPRQTTTPKAGRSQRSKVTMAGDTTRVAHGEQQRDMPAKASLHLKIDMAREPSVCITGSTCIMIAQIGCGYPQKMDAKGHRLILLARHRHIHSLIFGIFMVNSTNIGA
mmetsp:Transcript_91851/g.145259  ORF Transcript_91851/g.145259 Transcript_91851/m.145259 type:complete len:137 (+) Transcript_91851:332-742(+)